MDAIRTRIVLAWLWSGLLFPSAVGVLHAESYSLREQVNDPRTYRIAVQVQAKGKLKTPVKELAAAELPLDVLARMSYLERRLPAAGREDRAWRSLRHYEQAGSKIVVKEQTTQLQLSPHVREVVVEGQRSGLWLYARDLPLQRRDVDLLNLPGDPLTVMAALPVADVEVGESWSIPEWAAQMFVGVEAATTTRLTGKLLAVEEQVARLQFIGEVAGATTGAATKVTLNATATFDLKQNYVSSLKLIQQEERGISTVSPGMEVTATIQWERQPFAGSSPLTDALVRAVPFDPPPISRLLLLQSKFWDVSLMHDRNWHVFQEIPEVAVLRLVDSGSLISQCNIARIPKMKAGEHVSPEKFERDIKTSLGEQLTQIVDTQQVPTEDGRFIYRVVAAGEANELAMVWIYYLCAHPDGRQISFVFAVEQGNLESLNSQDLAIVESLEFLPPK
ncbi:MAG: hypothetical protein KDA76_06930 [Planctomycetaceae bacterium]|nr:hypothetical protein [Planctomycetaceae bacterium]